MYCAHRTREEDRRCPHCQRELYATFFERDKPRWIWMGWTVSMAEVIFSVGGLLVLIGILASALSVVKYGGQGVDISQLLLMYAGQSHSCAASGAGRGADDSAARAVSLCGWATGCWWSSPRSAC